MREQLNLTSSTCLTVFNKLLYGKSYQKSLRVSAPWHLLALAQPNKILMVKFECPLMSLLHLRKQKEQHAQLQARTGVQMEL